jgi:hypothetical protein
MSIPRAGSWVGDVAEVMNALGLVSDEPVSRIAPMLGMELLASQTASPAPAAERAAGQGAARPRRAARTVGASCEASRRSRCRR